MESTDPNLVPTLREAETAVAGNVADAITMVDASAKLPPSYVLETMAFLRSDKGGLAAVGDFRQHLVDTIADHPGAIKHALQADRRLAKETCRVDGASYGDL